MRKSAFDSVVRQEADEAKRVKDITGAHDKQADDASKEKHDGHKTFEWRSRNGSA